MSYRIVETKTRYVEEGEHLSAEEVEEMCCEPKGNVPCKEVVRPWSGYTKEEILEKLGIELDAEGRDEAGNYVKIRFVDHPPNGICGEMVTRYVDDRLNCCDEVEDLVWDDANSVDVMGDFTMSTVLVTGGKRPLNVSVRGIGFYLDENRMYRDMVLSSGLIRIYTGNACGTGKITVTDGCTTVEGSVRSVKGSWVQTFYCDGGIEGGDPDGPYPSGYPGGCPFEMEFPSSNRVGDQDHMLGGYRIRQFYSTSYPYFGLFATFEEALTWCQEHHTGASSSIVLPWRLTGNCFSFGRLCMDCECRQDQGPSINYVSIDPGHHGKVGTSYWYSSSTTWALVSSTRIYEWRC